MLRIIKPGTEAYVRVILTIVVLLNAVAPTTALAMPASAAKEPSTQSESYRSDFAQGSASAHVGMGFNAFVPEIVKNDAPAAQATASTPTPEIIFTPTPDQLLTQSPALSGIENKSPIQFEFSASPAQELPWQQSAALRGCMQRQAQWRSESFQLIFVR